MKTHISLKCFIFKEFFPQTMSAALKISMHLDPRHSERLGEKLLSWGESQQGVMQLQWFNNHKRQQCSTGEYKKVSWTLRFNACNKAHCNHVFPMWDLDHGHNIVPHCLQSLSIIGKLRAARSRPSLFFSFQCKTAHARVSCRKHLVLLHKMEICECQQGAEHKWLCTCTRWVSVSTVASEQSPAPAAQAELWALL